MTTTKLDRSGVFDADASVGQAIKLSLSSRQAVFRKNGIEFLSPTPISIWTELTVELLSHSIEKGVKGSGVVVECVGSRHLGFVVSLVFLNLPHESRKELHQLVDGNSLV